MKSKLWILGSAVFLVASHVAMAQGPAGSTGQCKDGTYTNAAKKSGACGGHKGVQSWFVAKAATPKAAAKSATPAPAMKTTAPAPAAAPMHAAAPAPTPAAPMHAASTPPASKMAMQSPAAGGGAGMVWVNTSSKVYHCQGSQYYGKTKDGKYMSESDATKMGAHADHGKGCSK